MDRLFTTCNGVSVAVGRGDITSKRIIFGDETLVLEENGDIFVHGKLVENDKEVVQALREFILNQK